MLAVEKADIKLDCWLEMLNSTNNVRKMRNIIRLTVKEIMNEEIRVEKCIKNVGRNINRWESGNGPKDAIV